MARSTRAPTESRIRNPATWLALALALVGCASPAPPMPSPPIHPNGQALWRIVRDQCVADQLTHNTPAPCEVVSIASGEARGFVVLKDRNGATQFLLLPTAKITGIEDPAILEPDAVNYFAKAW